MAKMCNQIAIAGVVQGLAEAVHFAKAAGLAVHAWTVRPENDFLPVMLRTGDEPKGRGCGDVKLAAMLKDAGVAGVFTDGPLKGRSCP